AAGVAAALRRARCPWPWPATATCIKSPIVARKETPRPAGPADGTARTAARCPRTEAGDGRVLPDPPALGPRRRRAPPPAPGRRGRHRLSGRTELLRAG